MKFILSLFSIMSFYSLGIGQGWLDYEKDIGDGYQIVRCNSFTIGLAKKNGLFIVAPSLNGQFGPIVRYWTTKDFVFLQNASFHHRNKFPGDSFPVVDDRTEYYFIVTKSSDSVIGPITKDAFYSNQFVLQSGKENWVIPSNPHKILPLLGNLYFTFWSIVIILAPILIVVLVIVLIVMIIKIIIKKKRNKDARIKQNQAG